jgi:hypothetical protein
MHEAPGVDQVGVWWLNSDSGQVRNQVGLHNMPRENHWRGQRSQEKWDKTVFKGHMSAPMEL